jgi:protein SCO1/2
MRRLPFVLLPAALVAALIAGILLWKVADAVPGVGGVWTTGTAHIGGPFTLIDQDGHKRGPKDFAGRYMLVYFGYTYCPDVCPTTLALMADALSKVGAKANLVVPIFITVDPARDTPAVLKAYLKSFGPQFVGLTGDARAIGQAASDYSVTVRKVPLPGGGYGMDHSSVIYLMGPDGKFITYWDDTAIGPDKLAEELRARL